MRMREESCPQCAGLFVRRSRRRGFSEWALGLAYILPFRCQVCRRRFFCFCPSKRYARVQEDRRDFERVPVHLSAQYAGPGGRGLGIITDLTVDGCALSSDGSGMTNTALQLVLDLQDGGPPLTVTVDAVVAGPRLPGGVGLKFGRMTDADRERLGKVVTGQLPGSTERAKPEYSV